MTEPLCALCGEDRDYLDHAGGELRHKFEPEPLTEEQLAYGRDVVAMRIRAEAAEADAKLAWRRVTELQERGTQLVEERRAETERCAGICDRLALLREHGAGEIDPGGRLRQAARLIRGGGK